MLRPHHRLIPSTCFSHAFTGQSSLLASAIDGYSILSSPGLGEEEEEEMKVEARFFYLDSCFQTTKEAEASFTTQLESIDRVLFINFKIERKREEESMKNEENANNGRGLTNSRSETIGTNKGVR